MYMKEPKIVARMHLCHGERESFVPGSKYCSDGGRTTQAMYSSRVHSTHRDEEQPEAQVDRGIIWS